MVGDVGVPGLTGPNTPLSGLLAGAGTDRPIRQGSVATGGQRASAGLKPAQSVALAPRMLTRREAGWS